MAFGIGSFGAFCYILKACVNCAVNMRRMGTRYKVDAVSDRGDPCQLTNIVISDIFASE